MRTYVISDAHGCLDEVQDLLRLLRPQSDDRVVFLGDLMDRGPAPVELVRFVRTSGYECVKSNHDEKPVRWNRHEVMSRVSGKKNPMTRPDETRLAQWTALAEADLGWLEMLPPYLDLGDGWYAVHAGFEPCYPLSEQISDRMLRVRYVDEYGRMVGSVFNDEQATARKATYWTTWPGEWKAPTRVVYGHAVHKVGDTRADTHNGRELYGIDSGAVYGGGLSALVLEDGNVVSVERVPSKKYAEHKIPRE